MKIRIRLALIGAASAALAVATTLEASAARYYTARF